MRLAALTLATLVLLPGVARADVPSKRTLYADGPDGRYLMGGRWLFRLDSADRGIRQGFMRQRSTAGWSPVSVPNAWNAGDASAASMQGGVGWYRKDFKLPSASAALAWSVRFESVNYRTRAWLNGQPIGSNTGAYMPFELRLRGLRRHGTNRLVVRVDSRRRPTDLPPSGLTAEGAPTGGWWNWSGILREVYLRKLDTVDLEQVVVRPVLACTHCAATVRVRVALRNVTRSLRRYSVRGTYGGRGFSLGARSIRPGRAGELSGSVRVAKPRLWSPQHPVLYTVRLRVSSGGRRVAGYRLHSGIRSIKIIGGRLVLNGDYLDFRGVGMHEDAAGKGFAIDDADRVRLVKEAKALGATVLRVHYPFSPYVHELADRLGLLIWSEIPMYAVKTHYLARTSVRRKGLAELRKDIVTNQNHPSVLLWSIGNELSSQPGGVQKAYIAAAARLAHRLDPTRPVGLAVAGYPSAGCQAVAYRPLDVIGLNDYFGWYPGPSGQLFDRTQLSGYLDGARRCYPGKALVVSEFGAEANRDGPVEEKGTYAFQQDFVNFQLGVLATKPWLSGAIYWALNEFWVRPGWDGGDPRPAPPLFQKGLITQDFIRKPAWSDVQRWFSQTRQLVPRG